MRNAKMTIAVIEERKNCKLPLTTGQEGLEFVTQATVSLVAARASLARAHMAFKSTQLEVGLQAFSYGDISECPPSSAEESTPLKIVA
jgi:hypothetical protein